jgi:2-isopropylmalate synthase
MALALSAVGAFSAPRSPAPRSSRSLKDGNRFTRKTARPAVRSRGETAAARAAASPFPYDADLDVVLYDTTLRDGSQQVGISLTCDDKLAVAEHLVALGVGYIEGGYPGSNPKDVEFFQRWFSSGLAERAEAKKVTLAAFGMTRRRGVAAENDEGLKALVECPAPCVCVVAKAWEEQCEKVLGVDADENLAMVTESVAFLRKHGKEVIVDCEHFFDGHSANASFAVAVAVAAARAGASHVVLCDTNGGTMPWTCEAATSEVLQALRSENLNDVCRLGTHAHNDTSLAVANSLAGVKGGARMVQGCVNGYGERTGNADVLVVAGNLELKMNKRCLPEGTDAVKRLTQTASLVAKACKQPLDARQAYVGSSAFAHKGGLHVAALAKMPMSYNHVLPELVGNEARAVVSELSGRGNIVAAAREAGRVVDPATATLVLAQIKDLESRGFVLEDAGATVEVLFKRADPGYRAPFNVLEFNVAASNSCFGGFVANDVPPGRARHDDTTDDDENADVKENAVVPFSVGYKTGSVAVNQAVVKVELLTYDDAVAMDDAAYGAPVGRKTELCVSEGNGPVNALANALRLALVDAYPQLERIHLRDYKVDLLSTEGTSAATTRVTMDFADKDSDAVWRTVGAHASIIEASFRALVDGMEFGIAQCGPDGCDVAARYDQEKREAPAAR